MERTWSARHNGGQARSYADWRPLFQMRLGRGKPSAVEALACLYMLLSSAVIAELTVGPGLLPPVSTHLQGMLCLVGVATILLLLADRPRSVSAPPRDLISPSSVALERRAQQLANLAETAARSAETTEQEAAASSELLGRISHAMRTPLNAIIGFSDLMEKELFGALGDPRYQDYSKHIREAGFDLLGTTDDVLAITRLASRGHDAAREQACVYQTVGEAIKAAADCCKGRGVAIASPLEGRMTGQFVANCDPRALRQALVNVLIEAVSAAEQGSSVTCGISLERDEISIEVRAIAAIADGSAIVSPDTLPNGERYHGLRFAVAEALLSHQGGRLLIEREIPAQFLARITLLAAAHRAQG